MKLLHLHLDPESEVGGMAEMLTDEPETKTDEQESPKEDLLSDDPEPEKEPEPEDDPEAPWNKKELAKPSRTAEAATADLELRRELYTERKERAEADFKTAYANWQSWLKNQPDESATAMQVERWKGSVQVMYNKALEAQENLDKSEAKLKSLDDVKKEPEPEFVAKVSREVTEFKKYLPKMEAKLMEIGGIPKEFEQFAVKSKTPMTTLYTLANTGKLDRLKNASEWECKKAWETAEKDSRNYLRKLTGKQQSNPTPKNTKPAGLKSWAELMAER
jgi:hypothetical protein